MRKNLNVLLGFLVLHDFFKLSSATVKRPRRQLRLRNGAAPLHLPGDTDAVPGVAGSRRLVLASPATFVSRLVNTRRVYCA